MATMTRRSPPLRDSWQGAGIQASRFVVRLTMEYSPKPDGVGSDLYLCGDCGIGLVCHPHGTLLKLSYIRCPNCLTLNES